MVLTNSSWHLDFVLGISIIIQWFSPFVTVTDLLHSMNHMSSISCFIFCSVRYKFVLGANGLQITVLLHKNENPLSVLFFY